VGNIHELDYARRTHGHCLTPEEEKMDLQRATESLKSRLGPDSGLEATVKLDFGADGVIFIDATVSPNQVTNNDAPAQCTLGVTLADFVAMAKGELSPTAAFMEGRLRVDGDMGVAMKLQGLF
jgi:putative sterol carrier protein